MRIKARVAAALGTLLLAGCGAGASSAPTFRSSTTIAPPSAKDLAAVVAASKSTLGTSATVSFELEAAQVFGAAGKPVRGSGSFDFVSSRGQALLSQQTGPESVIFLPASVFVDQAGGAALLPAGKEWISAGLTEQSLATNFPQFVTQVESLNPGLILSEIQWGAVSAAPTSPQAGQYSVEVDLVRAKSRASGPSAGAFGRAIGYQLTEMSGAAVATRLTVDVAIDGRGRVSVLRSSPPGAGMGTVTLSLSRYGSPVSVVQPARAQVVDISSLAPGGERENAGGGDSDGA
jgi:hypothetical protein